MWMIGVWCGEGENCASRKTSQRLWIQITLSDDSGSDQGYSCRDGEERGCVLKTELTGLPDREHGRDERKRGVKDKCAFRPKHLKG